MKTKSKAAKAAPTPKDKPTLVAFLLDRTGSMSACVGETISGFNSYIDTLKKDRNGSLRFTLTQFDSEEVEVIHNAVAMESVRKLNAETYRPRSMTPLYDAIGKTIRETEKAAGEKYKVLFVTLTDGQENASSEWTSESVKDLIRQKENDSKWTFAYIGVGLNGFAATQAVSAGTIGASNVMESSHKDTKKAYAAFAGATRMYASCRLAASAPVKHLWGHAKAK